MPLISRGDIIDLYYKYVNRGPGYIRSKFSFSRRKRIESTWNAVTNNSSNWWIINAVQERWNEKISGNKNCCFEQYIIDKYLQGKENASLLSIGCGDGGHEIYFCKHHNFRKITAIDIAQKVLIVARKNAEKEGAANIYFEKSSFEQFDTSDQFDIVLYHSSLHHISDIKKALGKTGLLLKEDGLLVICEYVGPNRFQYSGKRNRYLNRLLALIPADYKKRLNTGTIKKKIFIPGRARMYIADPSEAVSSGVIMQQLNTIFQPLEEIKLGGDILHFLLKDIAHNFLNNDRPTVALLEEFFRIEDEYTRQKRYTDFMFGVYKKRPVHS